jgi:hypothetical protein
VASGREWIAVANAAGLYVHPQLPAGTYTLTASHPGFTSAVAGPLRLETGQSVRLDMTLDVGAIAQTVDVIDRAVTALPVDATETAFVIDGRSADQLPVDGQNFLSLTLLLPGAVTVNPAGFTDGLHSTAGGRPYVNGNRKEANSFLLDGVDNNQTTDNLTAYLPSLDAIDEVRVVTNTASAEVGNYQGGLVSVTTRAGSNQLRGTAFGYFRDEALNATNWARNWQPVDPLNPERKSSLRHVVAGGTVGLPIVRNRLFLFADYLALRRRSGPLNTLQTFVTEAMRRGDFSALLDGPNPQQLYDPFTARPDPSDPSRTIRDPFPGNQIPLGRFDPVAAALFANPAYPLPSLPGLSLNMPGTNQTDTGNDQFDVRADWKPAARDDVVVRYTQGLQEIEQINEPAILMGALTRSPVNAALIQWNRQLGPRVVNEARVGFNRSVVTAQRGLDHGGLGNLGEEIGIPDSNGNGPGLSALALGTASTVGDSRVLQEFTINTFQYQDTLAWSAGRHLVKAGFLALRYQQNVYFSGNNGTLGVFEFNGQYTRDLNDPRSIGSGIADFVLGYPRRMARGDYAGTWGHRSTLWAGFVQDDWRIAPTVTVNLGLRYEYRTPFVEVHDRQVNFDLETGEARYAGQDGNSRALVEGYWHNWQPRVGAGWTPARWQGRLVLRGAYGIASFLEGTGTNLRLTLNPPYFNEFETINSPTVPGSPISDGFDALREKDPLTGTVLRAWDPEHRPARSHQWQVSAEVALPADTTVSLAYVGQNGVDLVVPVNYNQRLYPNGPRPFDPVYPQIGGVILTTPGSRQRYDALQVFARKRLSAGWSATAAYTWSKGMTDGRGFFSEAGQSADQGAFWANPRDPGAEWGPAPFDVTHNAAVSLLADLPWGRGRRWLSDTPAWLDAIVGGWSLAGIWRAHSGFAFTVRGPDQSQTGARTARPDRVGTGEGTEGVGPGALWFDTTAFVLPALGAFGNAGVGILRGPGLNVIDLSVSKQFALGGTRTLQFRVDAFNLLNHPVFNAPDRTLGSGTFGQVLSSQLEREIQLGVRFAF